MNDLMRQTNVSGFEFDSSVVDQTFNDSVRQRLKATGSRQVLVGSIPSRPRILTNTMLVMERLAGNPNFQAPAPSDTLAPYGRFRDRHIIGTGTRVLGGVFLGHRAREALIVDETDPKLQKRLRTFIQMRKDAIHQSFLDGGAVAEKDTLVLREAFARQLPEALFAFTRTYLVYDESRVARIFREAQLEVDAEFSLDHYLTAHFGVCRQMVLFLVAMFELLEKQGLTKGRMFLARCHIPNFLIHAWARYESLDGSVLILDPAQNFLGSLDQGGDMGKFVYGHEFAKLFSESSL